MFSADGAFYGILGIASLVLLGLKAYVFIDAVRRSPDAFVAADKQTKNFWLIILGLALVTQVVFPGVIGILSILGTVAALVYLVDAIPALRAVGGTGGTKHQGPYGPW